MLRNRHDKQMETVRQPKTETMNCPSWERKKCPKYWRDEDQAFRRPQWYQQLEWDKEFKEAWKWNTDVKLNRRSKKVRQRKWRVKQITQFLTGWGVQHCNWRHATKQAKMKADYLNSPRKTTDFFQRNRQKNNNTFFSTITMVPVNSGIIIKICLKE